jgi:hypothetical protein
MESRFSTPHTQMTPLTDFNAETGKLLISGKSVPENAAIFYDPMLEWLDQYIQMPAKKTTLTIQFEYFNTITTKILADIFFKLEVLHISKKSEVLVNWQYVEDDENMLETGEDYQSICAIPFNITPFIQ